MTDASKRFGFGSQEQQASNEKKQLLGVYYALSDESFTNLRNVAWLKDPQMILEEDGLQEPAEAPANAPSNQEAAQAATNVIKLVSQEEQKEQLAREAMIADAQNRVRAA